MDAPSLFLDPELDGLDGGGMFNGLSTDLIPESISNDVEPWDEFMWDSPSGDTTVDTIDLHTNRSNSLDNQNALRLFDISVPSHGSQASAMFDFGVDALPSGIDDMSAIQLANNTTLGDSGYEGVFSLVPNILPSASPNMSSTLAGVTLSGASPASASHGQMVTPPSSASGHGSPEPPRPTNTRKRKSTHADVQSQKQPRKNAKGQPVKKTSHNMIEKRYRNKLNDRIEELKNSVPSLKRLTTTAAEDEDEEDDLDGLAPAHKSNKATILAKATEYIKHLEKKIKQQQDEMLLVQKELKQYKGHGAYTLTDSQYTQTFTPSEAIFGKDPQLSDSDSHQVAPIQGKIIVPDNISELLKSGDAGPSYASRYVSHAYQNPPRAQSRQTAQPNRKGGAASRSGQNTGVYNKLMVGALAGMMILEGVSEQEAQPSTGEGRGLGALPLPGLQLLRRGIVSSRLDAHGQLGLFSVFRILVIVTALVYLLYPLVAAAMRPRDKKQQLANTHRAIPAVTLASPVELRQKAWLTASQGVWIPHHNIPSELAAIALEASKFCLRRLLGVQGYLFLTRGSAEREESRIKTWKIALDAQLTGGDVEISATHLILTLFASGTLPSTSATLMLKALHTRILLWRFAKLGCAGWYLFDVFCAKMSRRYWNKARDQLREETELQDDSETERLPAHLASLLQLDCLDVLLDPVVQRAYNLAWNRAIADNADPDFIMDAVVDDFAIASPLDALAAWYSTYTLDKALSATMGSADAITTKVAAEDVQEALNVAPPNSTAQTRALVAHAALLDGERRETILAAAENVAAGEETGLRKGSTAKFLVANSIGATPVPRDVKHALILARCAELLLEDGEGQVAADQAANRALKMVLAKDLDIDNPRSWTLLSFSVGFKVLTALAERNASNNAIVQAQTARAKEVLAGSLRLFAGKEDGRALGLSRKARARMIERCMALRTTLSQTKSIVASPSLAREEKSDRESGYGSAEMQA